MYGTGRCLRVFRAEQHYCTGVIEMSGEKLSVDELMGRGLEDIHDATNLMWAFNAVLRALPENATKDTVLGIFDDSWAECRGD